MSISATQFMILGLAALALTGLLTWPVRELAIRLGAMDEPNLARKSQSEPVPYLGGVAIALGITLVTFAAVLFGNSSQTTVRLAALLLLPALTLGLLGLLDDLRSLPAWPRLLIQTAVGSILALLLVRTGTLGTAFENSYVDTVITVIWIVGICNSINFFDNLDGAASGTSAIAALGVFFIAFDRGQELVSALSIVTAGATIGFLMWNKSPAKIYMGDAGALFLGVLISVMTIRLNPGIVPIWKSLAIPVMLLAVPLLDTCVAVFSRLGRGVSPLMGGKDHLSHRLVRAGFSRRGAAISLWFASGTCALIANGVYRYPDSLGTILVVAFAACWLFALGLFLRTESTD
jgi:UDP-GlcNAc:undecaprenyl-phosphate GlcNAc-1-phosphate transferase